LREEQNEKSDFDFHGVNKRFRRAERKHQALQQEVKNQFLQLDGKIMIRFDKAEENAKEIAKGYYRELVTMLDGYAGKAVDLDREQIVLGSEQNKLRAIVDENHKSNGAAITYKFLNWGAARPTNHCSCNQLRSCPITRQPFVVKISCSRCSE